jgi:MoxR-like ATPase
VYAYIVSLTVNTRRLPEVRWGVSPRGSIALMRAAQAYAFLHDEQYVTPDAVKAVAPHVLAHRLILDPHREYAGLAPKTVIEKVLAKTAVPTLPHGQHASQV